MPFGYGGPNPGWLGGLIGLLFFLIVVAIIVWAILMVARDRHYHHPLHWGSGPVEPSSDALKILNERFARGEISVEEYTERRDLIKGSS